MGRRDSWGRLESGLLLPEVGARSPPRGACGSPALRGGGGAGRASMPVSDGRPGERGSPDREPGLREQVLTRGKVQRGYL